MDQLAVTDRLWIFKNIVSIRPWIWGSSW